MYDKGLTERAYQDVSNAKASRFLPSAAFPAKSFPCGSMEANMNRIVLIGVAALALTATGAQACNYQRQMSANDVPQTVAATTPAEATQPAIPQDVAIGDVSLVNHLATD